MSSRKRKFENISSESSSIRKDTVVNYYGDNKRSALRSHARVTFKEILADGEYTSVECDNWHLTFGTDEAIPTKRTEMLNKRVVSQKIKPEWNIPVVHVREIERILRCFEVSKLHVPTKEPIDKGVRTTYMFLADKVWSQEIMAYGKNAHIEPNENQLVLVFKLPNSPIYEKRM